MGIGAVIVNGQERQELSEFLGTGTNNIAELTAIERALQEVPSSDRARMVVVHTDSSYSIGILDKGWKAKANKELIAEILGEIFAEVSCARGLDRRQWWGHTPVSVLIGPTTPWASATSI